MNNKPHLEETKRKMSIAHKGCVPWNKGIKECYVRSDETKLKMSKSLKGKTAWNKGRTDLPKQSKETIKKRSISLMGKKRPQEVKDKIGASNKGRKRTIEWIRKISESKKGCTAWNKGLRLYDETFYIYGIEFNEKLKDKIRKRDGYRCVLCKAIRTKKALPVHHKDYNKQNNFEYNLVTLCQTCHNKTGSNRETWTWIFDNTNIE